MNKKKVMKLASRGKRLGAFCIDAVAPAVACVIMSITLGIIAATQAMYYQTPYGYYGYNTGTPAGAVAAFLISIIVLIAYAVVQIVLFTKSQTLGKMALGLQVVSSTNGEPIGFWKMLLREWIVKQASAVVWGLGFIWILIDEKSRGWHDKILDTYVVDLKESEMLTQNRPVVRPQPAPAEPEVPEIKVEEVETVSEVTVEEVASAEPTVIESTIENNDFSEDNISE